MNQYSKWWALHWAKRYKRQLFLCKLPEFFYGRFIFNASVHPSSPFPCLFFLFPGANRELQTKPCSQQGCTPPSCRCTESGRGGGTAALFSGQRPAKATSGFFRGPNSTTEAAQLGPELSNKRPPAERTRYAPRPAVFIGHGVLLHDGREAKQREALEQVQLAGRLAADVRRCGRLGLVRELETIPSESPLPERPSEKPVTKWMRYWKTQDVT